jgi:hypothetical protein
MAEDAITTKSLRLSDNEGNLSGFLAGDENGVAALVITLPEEAPAATVSIGLNRESGDPFLLMRDRGEGASARIIFDRGQVSLALKNADGRELILTPS